jgi:hypothetical protein
VVAAGGHCPFGEKYAEASLGATFPDYPILDRQWKHAFAGGDQLGAWSRELGHLTTENSLLAAQG